MSFDTSCEVATKETIEYRFQSRLPSAQRVHDKFILVAAIDIKRVRVSKQWERYAGSRCAEFAEAYGNALLNFQIL